MGHEPAWQAEFDRQAAVVRPILFGIASRYVGQDEAEDVVQIALMRTWKEAPRLKGPDCYARWASMVARTAAIDMHRKRARHPEQALPDSSESHFAEKTHTNDAETAVLGQLENEKAMQALAAMPTTHAQVLLERDGLDMDYPDILARHGMTFGQLRNVLHRSRQRFRREFARLGSGLAAIWGSLTFWRRTGRAGHGAHALSPTQSVTGLAGTKLVVGGVAAGVMLASVAGVILFKPGEPAPDQVPIAAIITSTTPPVSSASAVATSQPAPTPRRSSAVQRPTTAPSTPARSSPSPAPTITATSPDKTASPQPPAPQTKVPQKPQLPAVAPASHPTTATSPSRAATPQLGGGVGGGTNPNTAAGQTAIDAIPQCTITQGSSITLRWSIHNSASTVARIGSFNGTGSPATIPGRGTISWDQTLPSSQTRNWDLSVVDLSGLSLDIEHYAGSAVAALPRCP